MLAIAKSLLLTAWPQPLPISSHPSLLPVCLLPATLTNTRISPIQLPNKPLLANRMNCSVHAPHLHVCVSYVATNIHLTLLSSTPLPANGVNTRIRPCLQLPSQLSQAADSIFLTCLPSLHLMETTTVCLSMVTAPLTLGEPILLSAMLSLLLLYLSSCLLLTWIHLSPLFILSVSCRLLLLRAGWITSSHCMVKTGRCLFAPPLIHMAHTHIPFMTSDPTSCSGSFGLIFG